MTNLPGGYRPIIGEEESTPLNKNDHQDTNEGASVENQPQAVRLLITLNRLLRFFSRLPAPIWPADPEPHGLPDPDLSAIAMPGAAMLIAIPSCLALLLASAIGLSSLVAACLALATLAITSGGLHEDGLADAIDACSGGRTRERALEIMRDSRIGAHGALGIVIVFALQAAALSSMLASHGPVAAALGLASAAITSRVLALAPITLLDPARPDGRGASFGRPPIASLIAGMGIALGTGLLATATSRLGLWGLMFGTAGALLVTATILALARKKIGGQTGDICGACQQASMTMLLIGFSLA